MLNQARQPRTRHALSELGALQELVRRLGARRNAALRRFTARRHAGTAAAQREFWLEFAWAHARYRCAVRRLARFCLSRH